MRKMLRALAILALLLVVPFLAVSLPILIVVPALLIFFVLGLGRTPPTPEARGLEERNWRRWYDIPGRFPDRPKQANNNSSATGGGEVRVVTRTSDPCPWAKDPWDGEKTKNVAIRR